MYFKASDAITIGKPISDGELLISKENLFALGFFSPGKSNYSFVGIWYNNLQQKTNVWVANRDNPVTDNSGVWDFNKNQWSRYWSDPEVDCDSYASCGANDVRNGGSGCLTWYDSLMDTQILSQEGHDLYVRVDAVELAKHARKSKRGLAMSGKVGIAATCVTLIALLTALSACFFRNRKGRASSCSTNMVNKYRTLIRPPYALPPSSPAMCEVLQAINV
ncbi:hypothetical protein K1719_022710 [Acacia pycnantha]|nr:hypothetical protein K1719_022710 [Acacia pycnantha]